LRSSKSLRAGQNLLIPLNPDAGKLVQADLREYLREDKLASGKKGAARSYRVRSGDSLVKIAKRFDVSVEQLRSWNRLGNKAVLRVGQQLAVSAGGGKKATARVAAN
jgi:membrane-bound lytic murein transglycosylase D